MKKSFLLGLVCTVIFSSSVFAQKEYEGNGKDMGVAINPVGVLFNWVSAEVNLWQIDRTAEINIPIQYMHNPFGLEDDDYDLNIFAIGVQYRKFFSERQEGFFVQAGWQYANFGVDGKEEFNNRSSDGNVNSILFGLGYRIISQSNGLFWAAALSAGKSWGTIEDPDGGEISGSGFAYDIDFFKIGYSW